MTVEIRDERFAAVVGREVAFETIASGCLFTEGPLWHPREHYLLWSDMPGDHLRRWSAKDGVTTFRKPCDKSNGLTWDREGRLLACEHATSRVTRTERDGRIVPLATHYGGKELNSPNDIVCAPDGGIYFSDPPYGRAEYYGVPRPQELAFQGVYRVGPDPRSPVLLVDDFDKPNGLCFSLDGRRLFINDTGRKHIRVFDVARDGTSGRSSQCRDALIADGSSAENSLSGSGFVSLAICSSFALTFAAYSSSVSSARSPYWVGRSNGTPIELSLV